MISNGTLFAKQTFDFETDEQNYSITVRVTDDHNISFDKNFTISLTNVVEDLDQDGTEDHYDDDIDGDGFTNEEELAYGSDPWSSATLPLNDSNFMSAINLWFDAAKDVMPLHSTVISGNGMSPQLPI